MAYLPVAQDTPWQKSDEIDLSRSAVLVVDVLGGSNEVLPVLADMVANSVAIVKAAARCGAYRSSLPMTPTFRDLTANSSSGVTMA